LAEVKAEVDALLESRSQQDMHDLTCLLLWVSRFGITMREVVDAAQSPEVAQRTDLLVQLLVVVSEALYESSLQAGPAAQSANTRLGQLWCNLFAPLLPVAAPSLSYAVLAVIARSQLFPSPTWPRSVATLCRLVSGQAATADVLELLFNADCSLNERVIVDLAAGDSSRQVPSDISNALVSLPNLPAPAQTAVLLHCPRVLSVTLEGRSAVVAASGFTDALLALPAQQRGELTSRLPASRFRDELLSLHTELHTRVRLVDSLAVSASTPPPASHPGFHMVFLFDRSGSMSRVIGRGTTTRMQAAVSAFQQFMRQRLDAGEKDSVTIIAFDDRVTVVGRGLDLAAAAAAQIPDPCGKTATHLAIQEAERKLLGCVAKAAAPSCYQYPMLILMSDGEADDMVAASAAMVSLIDKFGRSGLQVHTVAFDCAGSPAGAQQLKDLAALASERSIRGVYHEANDAATLVSAFQNVTRM
jgi:uncharacterized protein YegL